MQVDGIANMVQHKYNNNGGNMAARNQRMLNVEEAPAMRNPGAGPVQAEVQPIGHEAMWAKVVERLALNAKNLTTRDKHEIRFLQQLVLEAKWEACAVPESLKKQVRMYYLVVTCGWPVALQQILRDDQARAGVPEVQSTTISNNYAAPTFW